jgi:hypothetical protein
MKTPIKLTFAQVQACEPISDTIVDTRHWVNVHELVFRYEGRAYLTAYESLATEMQEQSGTDKSDVLDCYPAVEETFTQKKWVMAPAGAEGTSGL